MKRSIILLFVAVAATFVACDSVKRKPGSIYMPDMAYSRAYETYTDNPYYREMIGDKVPTGTVKRGEELPYHLANDSAGYAQSAFVKNPLAGKLTEAELTEAARLYNINCGICHGEKLDGNGPLYKGGEGPYPAKPATLVGDAKYEAMAEGTMFHSITYGKNLMGSYASQVTRKQRWMIVEYIKQKQGKSAAPAAEAPAADSASKK